MRFTLKIESGDATVQCDDGVGSPLQCHLMMLGKVVVPIRFGQAAPGRKCRKILSAQRFNAPTEHIRRRLVGQHTLLRITFIDKYAHGQVYQ